MTQIAYKVYVAVLVERLRKEVEAKGIHGKGGITKRKFKGKGREEGGDV